MTLTWPLGKKYPMYPSALSHRPTLPFTPTSFDLQLIEDRKGKCRSFFFFPFPFSFPPRTALPPSSFFPSFSFLFFFLISFLSFLFLLFFYSFLPFSPYPHNFFLIWLDLRKFPPSFFSLFHGHVSSHGPSIMCHVSPCEPCSICHMSHGHML